MDTHRKSQLDEFRNRDGLLYTPTLLSPVWFRPDRVQLITRPLSVGKMMRGEPLPFGTELHISQASGETGKPARVRPAPDVLERFLDLADASDATLAEFARRYGGLGAFKSAGHGKKSDIEYCEVWRYLARSMWALLMIARRLYVGSPAARADWDAIGNVPPVIRVLFNERKGDPLRGEYHWYVMTYFVAKGSSRNSAMLLRLLNSLVELGGVRPWLQWPGGARCPQLVYSGPALLSHLALQLCLRVAKVDALYICSHCSHEYPRVGRAPKSGQRNYCPECRKAGEPGRYALRDHRRKQRENRKNRT